MALPYYHFYEMNHAALSPLRAAADAHLLDTSDLSIEAAFRAAVDIVHDALRAQGRD